MTPLATHSLINLLTLAVDEPSLLTRPERIFEGWQNTSSAFPVHTLGYIFLVLLVVLLAIWLKQWYQHRPIDPTPNRLFHKLTRQVHLGLWDRWLLLRIARQQRLPSPLTLLLARNTLLHHGRAYAQDVSTMRTPMVLRRVQSIANRLYGSPQQAERDTLAAMAKAGFEEPPRNVPSETSEVPEILETSPAVSPVSNPRRTASSPT